MNRLRKRPADAGLRRLLDVGGQEHGYSPLNRLFFMARTQRLSRRQNTSARPPPRPPRVKNIPAEARGHSFGGP
jgi:hypothetical protein